MYVYTCVHFLSNIVERFPDDDAEETLVWRFGVGVYVCVFSTAGLPVLWFLMAMETHADITHRARRVLIGVT